MIDFAFIVNPVAAKGGAAHLGERLRNALKSKGLTAEVHLTERAGHATEIARRTSANVVVAVGGDGTINEVANGIVGTGRTLGIIPSGSGNDLVKSLDVPSGFEEALGTVLQGSTLQMDVGHVRCFKAGEAFRDGIGREGRYFVNGIGIGFDAAVAVRTAEIAYLRGVPLYLLAVFQTLGKYRPPEFTVAFEGGRRTFTGLLIAIGNGRCAGGGFYLTPRAAVNDGLLDLCMVNSLPIHRILRLMPKVMRGAHEGDENVVFARSRQIAVDGSTGFYVHADGEIVGRDVTRVEARICAEHIPVLVRARRGAG
jgi:YegS/Rv2252/BmrU family lipid kinase